MSDILSSERSITTSLPIFQRYVALSDAKVQQAMEDINDLSDEIQLNKQRLAKTAENTVNIFKKMMEINDKSEENKNENDLLNQSFQNLASNVETFDKRIGDIEKNDDDLTASLA